MKKKATQHISSAIKWKFIQYTLPEIADKNFADERLNKDIGKYRLMANEANVIIDAGYHPPSNFFLWIRFLLKKNEIFIDAGHINGDMIKNRLQNAKISEKEREILEENL